MGKRTEITGAGFGRIRGVNGMGQGHNFTDGGGHSKANNKAYGRGRGRCFQEENRMEREDCGSQTRHRGGLKNLT